MRRKTGITCMIMGTVLVLSALLILLHNQMEARDAEKAALSALQEVRAAISENARESMLPELEYPNDTNVLGEMRVEVIDGQAYIGCLSIPCLELELPIMSEWNYERLKMDPCRQFGSAESNDLVLAGHNYKRHFGMLHLLNIGDLVTFTDMGGKVLAYEVGAVETIAPTAVEEVKNSEWDLLLYTCTYGGRNRVAVGCIRMVR